MKKKKISLVGFNILNIKKINSLLFLSYISILSGCATSPENIAQENEVGNYVDCIKNQAVIFRENTPNQEVYPLFNIANNNCSPEREQYRKWTRLTLENRLIKSTNMKTLPHWAQEEIDKAMIKYENDVKNMLFDAFKERYKS